MTKRIGVKISVRFNIQNSAQKVEFVNSIIVVCLTSRYWLYVWSVAFGLTGEHWEDPQRLVWWSFAGQCQHSQ